MEPVSTLIVATVRLVPASTRVTVPSSLFCTQTRPASAAGSSRGKEPVGTLAVDVTVAGDDEPVPLAQRRFAADIAALTDARAKLARYAQHLAETHARHAQVMLALAGAATADPDAAAVWRKNLDERRHGMTMFAHHLAATGQLRPDRPIEAVIDVLWLAMDARNYDWLVRERKWSPEDFRRWYVDTVSAAILQPRSATDSGNDAD